MNNNIALVIATTGFSEEEEHKIKEASKFTRIFKSSNMSLGVNVLINLSKQATNTLANIADIEIIEKHHNKKVDAPSGTAKMIANAINKELDDSMEFNYGRSGNDAKRKEKEIGIHAIRGGTIPGEHTVIFAGLDEIVEIKHTALSKKVFAQGKRKEKEIGIHAIRGGTIPGEHTVIFAGLDEIVEIKHTALSKKVFAQGSIKAAQYILNKENGLYDMNNLINNN